MTEQQSPASDNYEYWYQQGKKQNDEQEYEQAISCFDRAIQHNSNAHDAWHCKGNAFYYLKRYEEAIDCYERAVSIKPDKYISFWARGIALYCLAKMDEAMKDYDRVLAIKPDTSEVWKLRGDALSALQRNKQALDSYEKALELQRKAGDRRGEISTLLCLTPIYTFNGRTQDSFLAQYQAGAIAKELNLSPDYPLYPLASNPDNMSPETITSIASRIDKTDWMGKLMGFATKLLSALFFIIWLLSATVSVAFLPFTGGWWLIKKLVRRT
jgi:tetratricopeptide (TPR) repeat protein